MRRPLLVLFALLSAACPGSQEPPGEATVVARVGDSVIDVGDFLDAARVRAQAGEFPRTGAGFDALRDRIVQELVVEEVLVLEAATRGLVVAPEDGAAAREAAAAIRDDPRGAVELDRILTDRFGDPAVHGRLLSRRLLVSKVERELRSELRAGISVTDEQVTAALERFAHQLVQPARIRCRQIFLESAEASREARRRLAEGEAFEALAQEYNGADGDMGWVARGTMPPLLAKAVEGLAVGRVSEVVRSPLGFHLFQLLGRSPATRLPEEEARATAERLLTDETVDVRFRGWVAARSEELDVTVSEEARASLRCCRQGVPYFGVAGSES